MSFSPSLLGSGAAGYAYLARTREAQQALLQKSPLVARDTEAVLARLTEVQTADELMDDYSLLKVTLGAFGLHDDLGNRAFIKKVLESDLADPKSLTNRLSDKRYLDLAKAFDFAGKTGPSLPNAKSAQDVTDELAGIRTADDLLKNSALLRATLSSVGLEEDIGNTFFLKSVLESDLSDKSSFANRLSDPRYAELAQKLNLAAKTSTQDGLYGFAGLFADRDEPIRTFDELAAEPELLKASLKMFGLEGEDDMDLLADVLNSDLRDGTSVAKVLGKDDPRYLAFAKAFAFTDRAAAEAAGEEFKSPLDRLVESVSTRTDPIKTPADLFKDIELMLVTFTFFDLPPRTDKVAFANRMLESDKSSATSLVNVFPDRRYRAFANAFDFPDQNAQRSYPAGFAEAIVQNYLDQQFEIQVGEQDPTMRVAMSLERELDRLMTATKTNDSRWFRVMSSKPLREVFEMIFQLPASFGTMDVDRQLVVLKARSKSFFGTSEVAAFAEPDRLEELRKNYLIRSGTDASGATGSGSVAMMLLSGL